MISPAKALVAILILLGLLSPAAAEVLRLDYEGFAVWLDCERHGAVKFRYNAQLDQGNVDRPSTFRLDPNVPARCQQTSTDAYQHPDPKYHRGHLGPANHLDNSETAIKQSNFMTNILPQTQMLNLGAWKPSVLKVIAWEQLAVEYVPDTAVTPPVPQMWHPPTLQPDDSDAPF